MHDQNSVNGHFKVDSSCEKSFFGRGACINIFGHVMTHFEMQSTKADLRKYLVL